MDEVIDATATPDAATPADQTTLPLTTDTPADDAAHPVTGDTPPVDPNEAMWGDLKADEPVDPNAAPPAIPEEFSKVLGISEYVKEPAHIESAVRTASEVWDVVSGKAPASGLLEAMRGQNPAQYEKTVTEDIIPYIEKITGKKFGGEAAAPDPIAEMRAEMERLKQVPLLEAQQREQQQHVQRAEQAGGVKIEEFIKAGNGIFDGDVQGAVQAVAAQFGKMGLNPQDVMKQVLAGNTATLEKAYKAAERHQTLQAKAYSDRMMARYKSLKGSVPTPKGAGNAAASGDEKADMTTQAGRAKWMAQQFKSGADIS